jgi:hypothetical protein
MPVLFWLPPRESDRNGAGINNVVFTDVTPYLTQGDTIDQLLLNSNTVTVADDASEAAARFFRHLDGSHRCGFAVDSSEGQPLGIRIVDVCFAGAPGCDEEGTCMMHPEKADFCLEERCLAPPPGSAQFPEDSKPGSSGCKDNDG